MKLKIFLIVAFVIGLTHHQTLWGQRKPELIISDSLTAIARASLFSERINRVKITPNKAKDTVIITAGDNFGYLPFRNENVTRIYSALSTILSKQYPTAVIKAQVYTKNIEELIPNYYRELKDSTKLFANLPLTPKLVSKLSVPYSIKKGLANSNIAVWSSHGRYFERKSQQWAWQRPLMFLSAEDLLTTAFVLPFLVPMLENAGAQVFIPRERDVQTNEVIVDNDDKTTSTYQESNHKFSWKKRNQGFSNAKPFYEYQENPFVMGTSRQIKTTDDDDRISTAEWMPDIPEKGLYGVYVSYQTTDNSTEDAHYTIHHLGGNTEFSVNQTVYGGTWLYLGHFKFDKGKSTSGRVTLSNLSKVEDKLVTADAVKFGGGIGNIAAKKTLTIPPFDTIPTTSNYPRYAEGARYWLQWAGAPDSVYSRTGNTDDYSDDFQSRGFWVNYLAGGSAVLPNSKGLGIPMDLVLAFHTDAGLKTNDTIIGTLGICTVNNNDGIEYFPNGKSRWASRDFVDMVQTQIVDDLRKTIRHDWTRRGIWNKSYSESRVPEVPTMLLELLAHQNFGDMKLALDPRFRFTVSRSIYKGMLKYMALMHGEHYVVQPLPVEQFSCDFSGNDKIKLRWKAVADSLEPTAVADSFIVYTRIDDGGFDNGVVVKSNSYEMTVVAGKIYSFKVAALNAGGESFPSEILAACREYAHRQVVVIVNGFERISGPENFNLGTLAGFMTDLDAGVPYLWDIGYTGQQSEFSPLSKYTGLGNSGFGHSQNDYEDKVIAGNTFDYPYIHGKAIQSAGYSFVSTSVKSVAAGDILLDNYDAVDLILGKQKQTYLGNVKKMPDFKTFPLDLQHRLSIYCEHGGKLMVSGEYITNDMWANNDSNDIKFVENLLKVKKTATNNIVLNSVVMSPQVKGFTGDADSFDYYNAPNDKMYFVERSEILEPSIKQTIEFCHYEGSALCAGVGFNGKYRTCTLGFPFETIIEEDSRNELMRNVLKFFFSIQQIK